MAEEEMLTVVDKDDNVLGYKPRSECHNREDLVLHREVHVLVFNSKGELLLQKRSMSKDTMPGWWTNSATGHVSKDETQDEAAQKELEEELKIIDEPKFITKIVYEQPGINAAVIAVYKVEHEGPFDFDREEVDEVKFFDKEGINQIRDKITMACEKILKEIGMLD